MIKLKNFKEFTEEVEKDPKLLQKLKDNPVETLKQISFTGPAYTSDKLVYRIVVGGFVGILVLGVLFFIYQYQRSLDLRIEYSKQLLEAFKNISTSDGQTKVDILKAALVAPTSINGTTPDGIIAVFTAIIGALAGLFAPSPIARKNDSES